MVEINPTEVNIKSEPSETVRLSLDKNVGQYIIDAADDNNMVLSKSVIVYSLLMYGRVIDYGDDVTQVEDNLDMLLESYNVDSTDIDEFNIDKVDITEKHGLDGKHRMQVQLPVSLVEAPDWSRKWSAKIEEALQYYLNTPYDSRYERINTKTDIISLLLGSKDKSDCSELSCEIFEALIEANKFVVEHPDDFKRNANLCKSVSDKKQLLKSYADGVSTPRPKLSQTFIDIFDYNDIYCAHRIINEVVKECELYEYGEGMKYVLDGEDMNNYLENIKSHEDMPLVMLKLLESYARNNNGTAYAPDFVDIAKKHKIIKKGDEASDLARMLMTAAETHDIKVTQRNSKFNFD